MSFLLDTSICIAVMNGRPRIAAERLASTLASGVTVAIPTVALFELWYGIARSAQVGRNVAALEIFVKPLTVMDFDAADARAAGELRAQLEQAGRSLGAYDELIAAQAKRHGLTLVTGDSDFSRVPELRWENWAR